MAVTSQHCSQGLHSGPELRQLLRCGHHRTVMRILSGLGSRSLCISRQRLNNVKQEYCVKEKANRKHISCAASSFSSEDDITVTMQGLLAGLDDVSASLHQVTSSLQNTLTKFDHSILNQKDLELLHSVSSDQNDVTSSGERPSPAGKRPSSADVRFEDLSQAEEANAAVSKVAFKLQQAFVQVRMDFLGKPFQLALEDFVDCTMEAYTLGVDLLTLQLQLLLAERACYGKDLSEKVQLMVTQEGHIRAMWTRLVYITLNHAEEVKAAKVAGNNSVDNIRIDPSEDLGGQGEFVKAVIEMHVEEGLTLDRLRLEQAYGEKTDSPAIEALKQSHYLILMTLAKALGEY